jgi:ferric iron reductase protein FhuF
MRASNKSAALRHSATQIVESTATAGPGQHIRSQVKALLIEVVQAMEASRKRAAADLVRDGSEFMDALPVLSREQEAAVRTLVNIYKATIVEDHEEKVMPQLPLQSLDAAALRGLLARPAVTAEWVQPASLTTNIGAPSLPI